MAVCEKCKEDKELYGKKPICKKCYMDDYNKKYYEKYGEKIRKQVKEYFTNNFEKCKKMQLNYRIKNKFIRSEIGKKQYQENKEIYRKRNKEYYEKNKVERNKLSYQKKKIRLKNDINFYIKEGLSTRIRMAIMNHGGIKQTSSIELLGADIDIVRKHIESQFIEGMCWENHGVGEGCWHIDHINPCDNFDLTKEEEQKKCFHYTNLQPLWYIDNIRKGIKSMEEWNSLRI